MENLGAFKKLGTMILIAMLCSTLFMNVFSVRVAEVMDKQAQKQELKIATNVNTDMLSNKVTELQNSIGESEVELDNLVETNVEAKKEYIRKRESIPKFTKSQILSTISDLVTKNSLVAKSYFITKDPVEGDLYSDDFIGRYSLTLVGTFEELTNFLTDLELRTIPYSVGAMSVKQNIHASYLSKPYDDLVLLPWFDKTLVTDKGVIVGDATTGESSKVSNDGTLDIKPKTEEELKKEAEEAEGALKADTEDEKKVERDLSKLNIIPIDPFAKKPKRYAGRMIPVTGNENLEPGKGQQDNRKPAFIGNPKVINYVLNIAIEL